MATYTEVLYGQTDRTWGKFYYKKENSSDGLTTTVYCYTDFYAKTYGQSGYRVKTKLGTSSTSPATVKSVLGYVPDYYNSWTKVPSLCTAVYSKSYTRKTSAYNVYVASEYYGEGTGGYFAGSTSGSTSVISVSIPALTAYTISYNLNGASGTTPQSQTKYRGQAINLQAAPSRTGYQFKGWCPGTGTPSSSATLYAGGASFNENRTVVMYAIWEAVTYTITYDLNGGTGSAYTTQTKQKGQTIALRTNQTSPTRTGYTFGGWTDNGSIGTILPSTSYNYSTDADLALHAIWTIKTYTVSYNLNGASGTAPTSQTKTYGQTLTLRSTTPTRSGYTFVKWNTTSGGTGTSYYPGGSYTANAGAILYAQWNQNYAKPTISKLSAVRVNSNHVASDSGTCIKVSFSYTFDSQYTLDRYTVYAKVRNSNASYVSIQSTSTRDSGLSPSGSIEGYVDERTIDGQMFFDPDVSYDIRVIITDTNNTYVYSSTYISTAKYVIDVYQNGSGMAIGKACERTNYLDVAWPITTSGTIYAGLKRGYDDNLPGIELISTGSLIMQGDTGFSPSLVIANDGDYNKRTFIKTEATQARSLTLPNASGYVALADADGLVTNIPLGWKRVSLSFSNGTTTTTCSGAKSTSAIIATRAVTYSTTGTIAPIVATAILSAGETVKLFVDSSVTSAVVSIIWSK